MKKRCLICHKTFIIPIKYSITRRKSRKYCSQECYRESPESFRTRFQKGHKGMDFKNNPSWKGGRQIDDRGYVRICIGKKKWKYEHRLVMEKFLGRNLKGLENIHHINHNRGDNRIKNLKLYNNLSSHSKFEHTDNIILARSVRWLTNSDKQV